jgi:hypothetical protein
MNLGMIGAIGGLGQAAIGQGDYLRRQEEADAEMGRRKNLEQWLMAARDEYAIKSEGRAETRTIATEKRTDEREDAKDAKTWQREQDRAPVKRDIAVKDAVAKKEGELNFETTNIDTLAKNKTTLTEAGETQSTRDLRQAQVGYYNDRGDAAAAKADDALAKLPPALKAELTGLDKEIQDTAKDIKKAKIEGSWNGTPDQKAIEAQLAAQRLRRSAILKQAGSPSAAPTADPLNLRKPAGKTEKTGMIGPTNAAEVAMKDKVAEPMGADPAAIEREIKATTADLQTVTDSPTWTT